MRRATIQQLESASRTLLRVTESEDVDGKVRDAIADVRHTLWRLVEEREKDHDPR